MKKILLTTLALISFCSNANILQELERIPATKLDVIAINLSVASALLKQQYNNTNSSLKLHDVKPFLSDDEIGLKMFIQAPAKLLTSENCHKITANMPKSPQPDTFEDSIYGLSKEQYKALSDAMTFKLELVSAENTQLTFACN